MVQRKRSCHMHHRCNFHISYIEFCKDISESRMRSILLNKKKIYCGWLNFRGVPIFVVFVEGPIHEFQYQRIDDFSYEL